MGFDEADLGFHSQPGQQLGFNVPLWILRSRDGAGKQVFGYFNGESQLAFGGFELKAVAGGACLCQHFRHLGFVEHGFLDSA